MRPTGPSTSTRSGRRRAAGRASTAWTSFPQVGATQRYDWDETSWTLESGYGKRGETRFHVVAVDYGVKRNILRLLNDCGCSVTVVPATATAEEILALRPDGVFLSNGPGDPAETGKYAVPTIAALLETKIPLFGICLGHQLLGLAVGGRTIKMPQGHHGANHPVKDFTTDKVEIVSMNHGFAVDRASLPANVKETHVSLFDGSNCGVALTDRPAFSVQYHPEASPGPKRQPLPVPPLRRPDGGGEGEIGAGRLRPARLPSRFRAFSRRCSGFSGRASFLAAGRPRPAPACNPAPGSKGRPTRGDKMAHIALAIVRDDIPPVMAGLVRAIHAAPLQFPDSL